MNLKLTAAVLALVAAPAFAQEVPSGDVAAGEKVFAKCQTCHVVANEAGEVLAGKNSKTGPNLYGLPGRVAGTMAWLATKPYPPWPTTPRTASYPPQNARSARPAPSSWGFWAFAAARASWLSKRSIYWCVIVGSAVRLTIPQRARNAL